MKEMANQIWVDKCVHHAGCKLATCRSSCGN